jgi:hypothetical protein
MVIAKKEQKEILFQIFKKLMFKKYNNNAKWVKGISIHIFIKNQNFIRCVMN